MGSSRSPGPSLCRRAGWRAGQARLTSPLLSQAFSIGSAAFGALKKVDKWIRLSEHHGQNGGRMGRNQKRATQTGGQCLPGQQHVTRGARGDPCFDNSQLFHTSVMRPCTDDLLSLSRNCPIRENGHNDARFSGLGSKRANA